GYTGAADFQSPDRLHSYHLAVGTPILKDGLPFLLDWSQSATTLSAQINEIYRALIATYAPALVSNSPDCRSERKCSWGGLPNIGFIRLPELRLTLWFDDIQSPQPGQSTIGRIELIAPTIYNDVTDVANW